MIKVLLLGLLAMASVLSLAGCETTEGAGRDIQSAGEAIEETAE
ncbi:MAG: entericidin A/B family lipoprotein [Cellvibrionaceae bacterium]